MLVESGVCAHFMGSEGALGISVRSDPRWPEGRPLLSDSVALAVGRVMVAYGHLDQTIYEQTHHLGFQRKKRSEVTGEAPSDPGHPWRESRLRHRLKELRTLIVDLAKEPGLVSAFDTLQTKLGRIELMRAHLAHGRLTERDGGVDIFDARGWVEMHKAWDKAAAEHREAGRTDREIFYLIGAEQREVGDRLINVWYSIEQIEGLEGEIVAATGHLRHVIHEAWLVAEKEYNAITSRR